MAFHEVLFPTSIALGASGGPERRTDIVTLGSGHEERNTPWAQSRRRFNAGYGLRSLDDLHDVIAFFEARSGRLHGFRWRDQADWKSCAPRGVVTPLDQAIGSGTGALAVFQLVKTYSSGGASYIRIINKPVSGTVRIAVDGVEKTQGTHFTLDATSGVVTFDAASLPGSGASVTAGFHFDVPVRFDTDHLDINLAAFHAGSIPAIPILELKL